MLAWLRLCWCALLLLSQLARAADYFPRVVGGSSDLVHELLAFEEATDEDAVLLRLRNLLLDVSFDSGETWLPTKDVKENIASVKIDPHHGSNRAFAFPQFSPRIYMTVNKGQHWKKIDLPHLSRDSNTMCKVLTDENDAQKFIVTCSVMELLERHASKIPIYKLFTYVTNDGGNSLKQLQPKFYEDPSATQCQFFRSGSHDLLCYETKDKSDEEGKLIARDSKVFTTSSINLKDQKPLDYFNDKVVSSVHILKTHLCVATLTDLHNPDSTVRLWISDLDHFNFKEAVLPTQLKTLHDISIIENNVGRIIIPIRKTQKGDNDSRMAGKYGDILISDTSGYKFEYLNLSRLGGSSRAFSTIEVLENLKGTSFGYVSSIHYEEGRKPTKTFETVISVDGGYKWRTLKVVDPTNKDKFSCDIDDSEHCFLSVVPIYTDSDYKSSGILLAVGSVSSTARIDYDELKTFVSRDGGLTWRLALDFPAITASSDHGNILLAVPVDPESDGDPQSEFYFSLDQGESWTEYQLHEPIISAEIIPTRKDGSGLKFVLSGIMVPEGEDSHGDLLSMTYSIDFSEAFDQKVCKDTDMEIWFLDEGNCINGAKYKFKRRHASAKCLIRNASENLELDQSICDECSDEDYECSYEFTKDSSGECVPDFTVIANSEVCSKKSKVNLQPKQLKSNNMCNKKLDIKEVEVSCQELPDNGADQGLINVVVNKFDSKLKFYQYFKSVEDESLIVLDSKKNAFISHDNGQTFKPFEANDEEVIEVVFNPYFNSTAYLFTSHGYLYTTHDRGLTFERTLLPDARHLNFPLDFSAKDRDSFIYYGGKYCDSIFNPQCHAVAYLTNDGGKTFRSMLDGAIHCEFVGSLFDDPFDENLIFCQIKEKQSNKKSLVSSTDYFQNNFKVEYENIMGYMSTGKFVIIAIPFGNNELTAFVTINGNEFAETSYPYDLDVNEPSSFTVLGSHSEAIFLHMTTNKEPGLEFGTALKSNSNGTDFVSLEKFVNRNPSGYVDFEKIQGLEGISVINVVHNAEKVVKNGEQKHLKSKITFNDGSEWAYITPPKKDSDGKNYKCNSKKLDKCSLNLHGYTERKDLRDTFSSGSALGMMFAIGNVGESLLPIENCSTFLTIDGGYTWKEVKKGAYQWEYGDHGGILVLVSDGTPTNTISYSTDMGDSWTDYQFTDNEILIDDLVTVPEDSALRFMLLGSSSSISGSSSLTFTIDFKNMFSRQCSLDYDVKNPDVAFSALNDQNSGCLFGHKTEYMRKTNSDCYIGSAPVEMFTRITSTCACTRSDFECDYNYFRDYDGTCKLVEGLDPESITDVCKKRPDVIEYHESSGYRKIPISTCRGGVKLDANTDVRACPGREKEFNEKYGISPKSFLLTYLISFAICLIVIWIIYEKGIRRNGGFARFGEIRLDDDELIENNKFDHIINTIVKSGVKLVSLVFTGFQTVKKVAFSNISRTANRLGIGNTAPSYSSLINDQFLDEADNILAGHDEDANDLSSFLESDTNFDINNESEEEVTADNQPSYTDDSPNDSINN